MDKIDVALGLIRILVFLWDVVTFPIYQFIYRPWIKRKQFAKKRCEYLSRNENEITIVAPPKRNEEYKELVKAKCETVSDVWRWCVKKYGKASLLGTRELYSVEEEIQESGKKFIKTAQGPYKWISYEECDRTIENLGRGLRYYGMKPGRRIAIFADTKAQWFISAQACFRHNFPLCTLYTNLGDDAVIYGLNQTEVTHIITSHELLPKFRSILDKTPSIKTVMYLPDRIKSTDTTGFRPDVDIICFNDVVAQGEKLLKDPVYGPVEPVASDPAFIMYTSGSTGIPKGVILSHKNIVSTVGSMLVSLGLRTGSDDSYLAFLPLAHIFELLAEMLMCLQGVKIGYAHPNTLTDSSTMVKAGTKGDAAELRPTMMSVVPLVLDRIYKAILNKISAKCQFSRRLFQMCYDYRLKAVRNGDSTPIMDRIIFGKIKAVVGGRLKEMLSGGAPLASETQDFITVCLGVKMYQGYGLTETCASASITEDGFPGSVGTVNQFMRLKLVSWEEGNYKVTDKPGPRGEIELGGDSVAMGYFNLPEKTDESFYEEEDGRRWFRTGDIGEITENGSLRIIDRKKDLVKLQYGEYVSLGKVEAVLKTSSIVENICVYGNPMKSHCVALVVPNRREFADLAEKCGIESAHEIVENEKMFARYRRDKTLVSAVLTSIVEHGKKLKLEKFELPGAITLCEELWDPESGLVTAAFKLKRKPIQDFYQKDIDRMYAESSLKTPSVRSM